MTDDTLSTVTGTDKNNDEVNMMSDEIERLHIIHNNNPEDSKLKYPGPINEQDQLSKILQDE